MSFCKVLVIGETGVGKTSLTNKMVYNTFSHQYKATIGCEFALKILDFCGETIKIQLWDLAGQDKLGGVSRLYCRDASAAILVADITNPESLNRAITWKSNVDEAVGDKIPMVMCLNKCDLTDRAKVTQEDAERLAGENQIKAIFLTSAKEGTNLDEVLQTVARKIKEEGPKMQEDPQPKGLRLKGNQLNSKAKKKCC